MSSTSSGSEKHSPANETSIPQESGGETDMQIGVPLRKPTVDIARIYDFYPHSRGLYLPTTSVRHISASPIERFMYHDDLYVQYPFSNKKNWGT